MRLANSTDPVVHTQPPKTTRHYVRIPGFDMFILIGIQTHSAKNVQGITHYFSKVRMWRHVATKRPEPLFEQSCQSGGPPVNAEAHYHCGGANQN
jgi:hypothetical protein